MESNSLFALDVGTRKVTGLLMKASGQEYIVQSIETREHKTRAMVDGQIHDIPKVAEVIAEIRHVLEEKNKIVIESAAVAAAGRSLHTSRGWAQIKSKPSHRLGKDDVQSLQYAAVSHAQQLLLSRLQGKYSFSEQYHCVGYSTVGYSLDGSFIGNLEGQRGTEAACEIIATFLPRVVVDSLRSVLELAKLKLHSMTLEPIAALGIVVPPEMRRLNIALIDIGAGTSDIVITRDGTVFAYDMVPVAGDELTEALCQHFLLEFMDGETVKRKIGAGGNANFINVLGEKVSIPSEEVCQAVEPILNDLGARIAQSVLSHNGTAPQAVFCVGGGSMMPGLTLALANHLGINPSRVVIKGKEMVKRLPGKSRSYSGPELVTPLGIGYNAIYEETVRFCSIKVNGQNTDVLDLGRGSVSEGLLAAGISVHELVGPPGKGICVEVNGQVITFPGEMGEMAAICLNGVPVSLENKIAQGDELTFTPAKAGADAELDVEALLERFDSFKILLNGKEYIIQPDVWMDNQLLEKSHILCDRDKLRILKEMSLERLMEKLDRSDELTGGAIRITLNDKPLQVPFGQKVIRVNEKVAIPQTVVSDGDVLEITNDGTFPTAGSMSKFNEKHIEITINGETRRMPIREVFYKVNGAEVAPDYFIQDGDALEIKIINHEVTIADILNVINFTTSPPSGMNRLVLCVNGIDAQFSTTIKNGDSLDIGWSA